MRGHSRSTTSQLRKSLCGLARHALSRNAGENAARHDHHASREPATLLDAARRVRRGMPDANVLGTLLAVPRRPAGDFGWERTVTEFAFDALRTGPPRQAVRRGRPPAEAKPSLIAWSDTTGNGRSLAGCTGRPSIRCRRMGTATTAGGWIEPRWRADRCRGSWWDEAQRPVVAVWPRVSVTQARRWSRSRRAQAGQPLPLTRWPGSTRHSWRQVLQRHHTF